MREEIIKSGIDFIENIPLPVVISRASDGVILYVNDHLGQTFGLPAQEAIGQKTPDFYYDPADRQVLLDELSKRGFLGDYEVRAKKADGTPFWVAVSIHPVTFQGESALFATFLDITERKKSEEELQRLNEELEQRVEERTRHLERKVGEFRGLYEVSDLFREELEPKRISSEVTGKIAGLMDVEQCCIILYDTGSMEFNALPPACGISDEQLGVLSFSLEDAADLFVHWEGKDPLVSNEPSKDEELTDGLSEKLGEHNFLLAKLLVGGEFLGILRLANKRSGDFTSDDARLAGILASRLGAALHTMMLFQELRKYTKELEDSNRLKDLFTDIMRHDLLNPVGVIKGFSEIVSMDMSPEEHRRVIERIRKSAEKLEEMIHGAATLAKVEAWEKLDFEERELCEILKGVVLDFKPLLKEEGMKVKFEGGRRCLARVNTSIEDVFANLLSNAIKYSPEKTKIIVGIEDVDKNWKIYFKDQGDGIPDEYKEAIFGRFKRGGKKGVKGTGLGLAIVKRIVELHKGRVWVEDNPGGGSIFYVQLPK